MQQRPRQSLLYRVQHRARVCEDQKAHLFERLPAQHSGTKAHLHHDYDHQRRPGHLRPQRLHRVQWLRVPLVDEQPFFITGPASTSARASSLSIQSANYPLNRFFSSIYTFTLAFTNNRALAVSTLQIDIPSLITQSKTGITCGYQPYLPRDNYFSLMLKEGTNILPCNMTGQRLMISQLAPIIGNLSNGTSTSFLYLTVNGLINPAASVSRSNFTFTFINTSSTFATTAGIFTSSLSYAVSGPPLNLQISSIVLSDTRFFVNAVHTFTVTSVQSANINIAKSSNLGAIVRFPAEYADIWEQITPPTVLTINAVTYTATNITLKSRYLFARFPLNAFANQLTFASFTVAFNFRNPNKTIDCTATTVFVISFFNFQSNSLFAQTLSNNKICPTLTNRLFAINVTGNTKISAGSSATFLVSIERPASYLAITPACTSSAISFIPSVIVFSNFTSVTQSFSISAAVGLSGSFNVTFSKTEGGQNFYNDIQFTTLNIFAPIHSYKINVSPFSAQSIGYPIETEIELEVPSPTDFALTYTTNCNSNFSFNPAKRINIPAQAKKVSLYITYTGSIVPAACRLNFTISALTNNNFELATPVVYLSARPSFDRSSNRPPLILELTTNFQNSTQVGTLVFSRSNNSSSTSSSRNQQGNRPTLYEINATSVGANSATFSGATSIVGTLFYVVLPTGTPTSSITQSQIYSNNLTNAIQYGNSTAALNSSGVNIFNFVARPLSSQTNFIIGAYLNSTLGASPILFRQFSTGKASNGASIKFAMSSTINSTALLQALSNVWRIQVGRISVLTVKQTLIALQNTFRPNIMNNRSYVYQIVVAPDINDDSIRPLDLLNAFIQSNSQKNMLLSFIPQYLITYSSPVREIVASKPRQRSQPAALVVSHDMVTVQVKMWEQAYVYAVIVQNPTNRTLSSQVIRGLNANNLPVISQNYVSALTDQSGVANITFTHLSDNTSYTAFISAECVLPFVPRLALSDQEVMALSVQTHVNLNLMKNSDYAVDIIKKQNPVLAEEVKKQIQRTKAAASKVVNGNQNGRRRNIQ